MTDIVQILREMQQEEDCPMLVHMAFSEAISEITRLRAELASASVYKPCQRKDTPHVPVKAIGECNERYWFKGIRETDDEFAARAGKPHKEVTE